MKHYEALEQEVQEAALDEGLSVVLLKKPGFEQKYLSFSTHYGGIHSAFIRPGESTVTRVPDGIAHFLEHKIFEEPDGVPALEKLSRIGASPNAYTGTYYTVYHCSLVDRVWEGLDILLDFVQTPYFTDENVAKEQGIIGQEIQMGLDSPVRMVHYNLLESLFREHPARIRIIGTVESISRITKELLYLCHDTFYHPSNMLVVAAGDIEFDRLVDAVGTDIAARNYAPRDPVRFVYADEPEEVAAPEVRHKMKVSRPRVLVGFKGRLDPLPGEDGKAYQRRQLAVELALDAVLGKTTGLYWSLYEKGVIAASYGYSLTVHPGAAYIAAGAESEDPDAFRDRITEALAQAASNGIDRDRFEEARRREIGQLASALDDPDWLVQLYTMYRFRGMDIFERREILDSVDAEEGARLLREFVRDRSRSCSIIEPLG